MLMRTVNGKIRALRVEKEIERERLASEHVRIGAWIEALSARGMPREIDLMRSDARREGSAASATAA